MDKSVRRPSPALIVAIVALVAALAGTAVALPGRNTVSSNDIKKNAVRSSDVKNDSLKGKDIKESTLGTVPSAETAQNLAGHARVAQFVGHGTHALANFGPFTLSGDCDVDETGTDNATLRIETSTDGSVLASEDSNLAPFGTADNPADLTGAGGPSDDPNTSTAGASLLAIAADGTTITSGDYFAAVNVGGQANQCYFGGTFEQLR